MPSSPISPCPSCPPHAAGGHGCAVYSSSVTDAEWAILEPLLPAPGSTAGRGGRPEKHCRRVIVDAILYIVRGGIAWRQLPVEFPPAGTVYAVFARWARSGAWQRILDALRDRLRVRAGRDRCPTAAIIDSQTVPAADTASSSCWPGVVLPGLGVVAIAARYKGYRYPIEVIGHAVWLYHCFALSLRDVEELMLARGVVVTYETIRSWCGKFGPDYANQLRRRRPRPGDKWHLDEVFVKINGVTHYLWRAVDQHGDVLDILVQSRRNAVAAKRFFRKLLKGLRYVPRVIVTDKLASYQP